MASLAAGVFGRIVGARERAYRGGWLGVARLPAPVVSVGNLSVGGSGKTPAVIALGLGLLARGWRVDVLTRGYGRRGRNLAIAEAGEAASAAEVGDEPLLVARRLGAPVLVHPDRFRAGCEGERRFQTQIHLLDDGFQHRQLARDVDIVLVRPADLDDRLLPAGRLRERPTGLARASAVLLLEAEGDEVEMRRRLGALTGARVWRARRRALPGSWLTAGLRLYAFCGLARPESFWRTLAEGGVQVAGRRAFRDHHHYSGGELRRLGAEARAAGADALVTTAKDAVKLDAALAGAARLPLHVVDIELEIAGGEALLDQIEAACRGRLA